MPLNKGLTELSVQALVASGGGVLYAGTSAGVFRSEDEGESWAGISEGLGAAQESAAKSPWDHLGRSGKP
jgi:ligand-binding sensor domain-containing protein